MIELLWLWQDPLEFIMRGKIDDEDIGLQNIPGYHLAVLKLKSDAEAFCNPKTLNVSMLYIKNTTLYS
jgi:hypothetical protein